MNKHNNYYLLGCITFGILFSALAIAVKSYDSPIFINRFIYEYVNREIKMPLLSFIALFISLLGDKYVVIPTITLTSLFLYYRQQKWFALHFFGVMFLAAVLAYLLKNIMAIPRPGLFAHEFHKYAFPSRHVLLCTTYLVFLYGVIASKLNRFKWQGLLLVLAIIIVEGLSRITLGVHWLTDIIGGFLLGTACGLLGLHSYNLKSPPEPDLAEIFRAFILFFCLVSAVFLLSHWNGLLHEYKLK